MPPSIFIETTIPSYYVARPSHNLLQRAHQKFTKEWWDHQRQNFSLYTSQAVLNEAAGGEPEKAVERLRLLADVPLLDVNLPAVTLADQLLTRGILPPNAGQDALHLSVAGVYGVRFLLTWNCRHLANPYITDRLRICFSDAGRNLPVICTPEQFVTYAHNYENS